LDADPVPTTYVNTLFLLFPVAASFPRSVKLIPRHVLVKRLTSFSNARKKYANCLCFGTGTNQNNLFIKKYKTLNEY
jgi:hypothetical protein